MKSNARFVLLFVLLLLCAACVGGIIGVCRAVWDTDLRSFIAGAGALGPIAFLVAFLVAKRRCRPNRVVAASIFTVVFLFTGFWFLLFFPAPPEGKFPIYSDIDTRFAPGYTDQRFDLVSVGMSESNVVAILGQPMYRQERSRWPFPGDADFLWWYSQDGACSWGDYAWRAPIIGMKNGTVVTNYMVWCYD
jgi:hypothetical protein